MVPLSILDLVPVIQGSTPREALQCSLDLVRHAERLGYTRYWVAEHHNMTGIASAATSVVIGFLAGGTTTIRVGAGGIMLPNHSPLQVAEQFGTLESLYPGRIDLGLGRAPGTDQLTIHAMRRDPRAADDFPQDVKELQALFAPVRAGQRIQAVPGAGLRVPLWILGSSMFGAQLAAHLGLPYAFASHFAPAALHDALAAYRARFQASEQSERPHAMVGVNVVVAETDREAQRLFTTLQQAFTDLHRGTRGLQKPPIDDIDTYWTPAEKIAASSMLKHAIVGSPQTVRAGLERFVEETKADEVMVVTSVFDHDARKRSYEILADLWGQAPRST
ncbi:Luciferase-like monooxygenase [Labilithrix luteola]|uniref:Luciferase-like monooxygenase n=1 Tax=Labilithrix luteola TaxID=1391654 RepID=A0A0K1QE08_9BACT|nr:LLM class flavin-dependent oxidoreductase [Labilithrix luteola]AKV04006.1 Luciferase-like monooxygenase [Labilithrix luteola]